jgi:hypothetical protein
MAKIKRKVNAYEVPKKYAHIDFTPPKGAQEAAKRALKVRASMSPSKRGMTPVGIARARDLSNGKTLFLQVSLDECSLTSLGMNQIKKVPRGTLKGKVGKHGKVGEVIPVMLGLER